MIAPFLFLTKVKLLLLIKPIARLIPPLCHSNTIDAEVYNQVLTVTLRNLTLLSKRQLMTLIYICLPVPIYNELPAWHKPKKVSKTASSCIEDLTFLHFYAGSSCFLCISEIFIASPSCSLECSAANAIRWLCSDAVAEVKP